MAKEKLISFKLENLSAGGSGIVPEGWYLIKSFRCVEHTLPKAEGSRLYVKGELQPLDGKTKKANGEVIEGFWSIADVNFFQPANNGKGIKAVGDRSQLADNSNFAIFLQNAVNAGFEDFDDDLSVFEGLVAHFIHIPAPERENIGKKTANLMPGAAASSGEQKREFKKTIPVIDQLDEKASKAASKATAKEEPAEEPETDDTTEDTESNGGTVEETAIAALDTVLNKPANKKGMKVSIMRIQVRAELKDATDEEREKVNKILSDSEWLTKTVKDLGYKVAGSDVKPA